LWKEVPALLNLVSGLDAAAEAGMPAGGAGVCLPSGVAGTAQPRTGAVKRPRPRAFWAAEAFGHGRRAADLAAVAFGQPNASKEQYPHTTRIAASGGAKGPHPVREREPA
jgi:hypothetical protein